MRDDFAITTAQVGAEEYVVTVVGEVDMYRSPDLDRNLAAIAVRGGRRVVVDLSEASFIDSTVLALLVRELKRLDGDGGKLLLVSSDPRILRAFEITGLDRLFTIEPSLTRAVAVGTA